MSAQAKAVTLSGVVEKIAMFKLNLPKLKFPSRPFEKTEAGRLVADINRLYGFGDK